MLVKGGGGRWGWGVFFAGCWRIFLSALVNNKQPIFSQFLSFPLFVVNTLPYKNE
jgi:hypothetical protein